MAEKQAPPKVPPRNDFTSDGLYRNSRSTELQGRDKDFVYETFSTDPASPAYIGNRLSPHERGNPATGFVMVGAWEVVHSQTDRTSARWTRALTRAPPWTPLPATASRSPVVCPSASTRSTRSSSRPTRRWSRSRSTSPTA